MMLQPFAWSDLQRRGDDGRTAEGIGDSDLTLTIRSIERRRKQFQQRRIDLQRESLESLGRFTLASFQMDALHASEGDVVEALLKGGLRGDLRSRQAQMIRNHAAILRHIDRRLRKGISLKPATVLGWYAVLCGGLPATGIDGGGMQRLEQVCRQINSPPMRLHQAIADVAALYHRLLEDPLVPAFNGILARLLMRFHLGRCALPQVVMTDEPDRMATHDERRLYGRLVMLLDQRLSDIERQRPA